MVIFVGASSLRQSNPRQSSLYMKATVRQYDISCNWNLHEKINMNFEVRKRIRQSTRLKSQFPTKVAFNMNSIRQPKLLIYFQH
jgi:hypothetical protein